MERTIRTHGIILAFALLLFAAGMNASATHSDDAPMEVPSEISPIGPEPDLDPNRVLKLSPSDTENALHITLSEVRAPQESAQARKGGPLEVAFHREMPEEFQNDLTPQIEWVALDDESVAGTVSVTSPGATDMRMGVLVDLPPGGEMRFFGTDTTQHFPVITREDIDWEGDKPQTLWSPVVEGDTVGVEIVLPSEEALSSFSFEVDRISHGYGGQAGFGISPVLQCSNHIDVQCAVGRFPRSLENAVARIRFETGRGGGTCTGTLMSDSIPGTFVPYFLTARHCISTATVARSVTARWFYQRAPCGSSSIDSRDTTTGTGTGADLLATSPNEDMTLLRFRASVPGGVAYSGWNRSNFGHPSNIYGIHHPSGEDKKFAAGRTTQTTPFQGVPHTYRVEWSEGSTEPGSSGSGLFRQGRLIGTLYGGPHCSQRMDYYGSFSHFFPQVSQWLAGTSPPPPPPPPPRDDHGNTPGTATNVSIPSTTPGVLEEGGDKDYFRLNVPRAGEFRAFTTGSIDTYGTLFRGTTRVARNDDGGSGRNFRIAANVQPGTHYIEVRGFSSSTTGPYSLRVELSGSPQTAVRTLPFVTPASNRTQRSLVRIINRSDRAGRVSIHAIDDAGNRRGPAHLQFAARQTKHFDSQQLEGGRGMAGGRGVGDGQGNWRLELSTTLDIAPLAYVRGDRGFVTTMHDVVPSAAGRHHVVNFNKAPVNPNTDWSIAQLRLINPNNSSASVTIAGVDDLGRAAAGGTVRLTLGARAARMVTSTQLENGGGGLTGRLGNRGTGRWQLTVTATRPIWVMGLMSSPSAGYITNLSSQRVEP